MWIKGAGADIYCDRDWIESFKESIGDDVDADRLSSAVFAQRSIILFIRLPITHLTLLSLTRECV